MSTALADDFLPTPIRKTEETRRLQVVPATNARKRPKLAYGLIAAACISTVVVVQIIMGLLITQDSFALAELRVQERELGLQVNAIEAQVAALQSPQNLAASADALGMVAATSPAYLRLSDGKLFGKGMTALAGSTSAGSVSNSLIDLSELSVTTGAVASTTEAVTESTATTTSTIVTSNVTSIPTPNTR